MSAREIPDIFWNSVERRSDDECWPWKGAKSHGYGIYYTEAKRMPAHRRAYELTFGEIPDGLVLDHKCHNGTECERSEACPHRSCVNPSHLEPVTDRENARRGDATVLTARQVAEIKSLPFVPSNILGCHFGVSIGAIGAIREGSTWVDIEPSGPSLALTNLDVPPRPQWLNYEPSIGHRPDLNVVLGERVWIPRGAPIWSSRNRSDGWSSHAQRGRAVTVDIWNNGSDVPLVDPYVAWWADKQILSCPAQFVQRVDLDALAQFGTALKLASTEEGK